MSTNNTNNIHLIGNIVKNLHIRAPIESPNFTGVPKVPTLINNDFPNQIPTVSLVNEVFDMINSIDKTYFTNLDTMTTGIGINVLNSNTGLSNNAFGSNALESNTNGSNNVDFGSNAL